MTRLLRDLALSAVPLVCAMVPWRFAFWPHMGWGSRRVGLPSSVGVLGSRALRTWRMEPWERKAPKACKGLVVQSCTKALSALLDLSTLSPGIWLEYRDYLRHALGAGRDNGAAATQGDRHVLEMMLYLSDGKPPTPIAADLPGLPR